MHSSLRSTVTIDYISGQRRPRSVCADAQADLGLCCPHMSEDTFLHDAASYQTLRVKCYTVNVLFSVFALLVTWLVHVSMEMLTVSTETRVLTHLCLVVSSTSLFLERFSLHLRAVFVCFLVLSLLT